MNKITSMLPRLPQNNFFYLNIMTKTSYAYVLGMDITTINQRADIFIRLKLSLNLYIGDYDFIVPL
jgi:hypothetical protein